MKSSLCDLLLTVFVAAVFCAQAEAQDPSASAGAQARLRALFAVQADWFVPKEVNPQDDKLRLLLLIRGGPLLIEAQMALDGGPYAAFFEEQIDLLSKGADRDGDGKVSWQAEGMGIRLPGGRLSLSERDKGVWLPALDLDQDGIASRYELRRLLCLAGGGPPLVVGSPLGNPLSAETCYGELADKDDDGTLSAEEISQLGTRLKLRDANDNELVDSYELLGAKADNERGSRRKSPTAIVLLTKETDWAGVQKLLKAKYGGTDSPLGTGEPRLTELTANLDRDDDRAVDAVELSRLLTVEPHIGVEVNLCESGPKPCGAFIQSFSDSLCDTCKISRLAEDKKQILEISGIRLAMRGFSSPAPVNSYDSLASNYLTRFDKDNNGYLDNSELPRELLPWDADGDMKVFAEEIAAFFRQGALLTNNRIHVTITDEKKDLLSLVDVNNDGKLSLRELSETKQRLLRLDANENGQLDPAELLGLLRITFTRGSNIPARPLFKQSVSVPAKRQPGTPTDWFAKMDANGDGDISKREFLGTPELFDAFDNDHDGLLSRVEVGHGK
jgi:Ca2+-binding EF-hand superfamily protein